MENSTCTVFFDGRFWIALAVRTDEAGVASIARHVFGPEPTNPELLRFYLFILPALRYLPGVPAPKPEKKPRSDGGPRRQKKSLEAFKLLRAASARERKRESGRERSREARIRYEQKAEKRKLRKRGK